MPKYQVTVSFLPIILTIDTDSEDFAEHLKELEIDVNDPDAIHDWVMDYPETAGVDLSDVEIEGVTIKPFK